MAGRVAVAHSTSRTPWNTFGMARHELFAFKFFDPIRRRWIAARYKATREEIAARYGKWEIIAPGWTPNGVGGTCGHVARSPPSG
jgi:hypothetical protein